MDKYNINKSIRTNKVSIHTISIKYGLITAIGFTCFFLLINTFNLIAIVELRMFHLVILFAGIYSTMKAYSKINRKRLEYMTGFMIGIAVSFYSLIPFAIFSWFYFEKINPDLLKILALHTVMLGSLLTPLMVAITIITEGLVAGLLVTFVLMQYFQNDKTHS